MAQPGEVRRCNQHRSQHNAKPSCYTKQSQRLYAKELWRRKTCVPNSFYTKLFLHPRTCAPKDFYTKQPLSYHYKTFTSKAFYTRRLANQTAFTCFYNKQFSCFYAKQLLRQKTLGPETFHPGNLGTAKQLLYHSFHQIPFACNGLFHLQQLLHQKPFTLHSFYSSKCFNRTVSKLLCQGNLGTKRLVYQAPFSLKGFYVRRLGNQTDFSPENFTSKAFHTKGPLPQTVFTPKSVYKGFFHQKASKPNSLFIRRLLHKGRLHKTVFTPVTRRLQTKQSLYSKAFATNTLYPFTPTSL